MRRRPSAFFEVGERVIPPDAIAPVISDVVRGIMSRDIVNRVVELCASLDGVRAIALMGSRALGLDGADDWDLCVFTAHDGQPGSAQRKALWGGAESPVTMFPTSGRNDRFRRDGPGIGIDYGLTVSDVDLRIAAVVHEGAVAMTGNYSHTLGECPEAICADISTCESLWDPQQLVRKWKQEVETYPEVFRLNMLEQVLFQARFKLKDLRRATELQDVVLFHVALSEMCFCLLRILFAVNRVYFRGLKWAMRAAYSFAVVPDDWLAQIERLLCTGLTTDSLGHTYHLAREAVTDIARLGIVQGAKEKRAVEIGLCDWPDVDPLKLYVPHDKEDQATASSRA